MEAAKAAIDALGRSAETALANEWLTNFSASMEAWQVADELSRDVVSYSYRFWGAKILHTKVQRDFNQLSESNINTLTESLVSHIISLSKETSIEMTLCRFICMALSALAVQMNRYGIVGQILLWLNPILSSQPAILLELLIILPEECYNQSVDVDNHIRDQFSHQLTQSALEVFAFLASLQTNITSVDTKKQILRCLDRWIENTDIPVSVLVENAIFNHALECLTNQSSCEEAIEVVITTVRKYGYHNDPFCPGNHLLLPKVLPAVLVTGVMKAGHMKLVAEAEGEAEEETNVIRALCRLYTEVGEAYMTVFFNVSLHSSVQLIPQTNELFKLLLECVRFEFDFSIARIPLKYLYDISMMFDCEVNDNYSDPDSMSNLNFSPDEKGGVIELCSPIFTELLNIVIAQLLQPSLLKVAKGCGDDDDREMAEWLDLVTDCCVVMGGSACLQQVCSVMQCQLDLAADPNAVVRWDVIQACFSAMCVIGPSVPKEEAVITPQLLNFIVTTQFPVIPTLQSTCAELLGGFGEWLSVHTDMLPNVLTYLVVQLQKSPVITPSNDIVAKSIKQVLCDCKRIPNLPINDLHQVVVQLRDQQSLSIDGELLVLEGLCTSLSYTSSSPDTFNSMLQSVANCLLLQIHNHAQHIAALEPKRVANDISRLTTLIRFTVTPHAENAYDSSSPLLIMYNDIMSLCTQVMQYMPSESTCEKICRLFKYLVRAIGKQFVPMVENFSTMLLQYYQSYPFSCFIYAMSVLVSEFSEESVAIESNLVSVMWNVSDDVLTRSQCGAQFGQHPHLAEEYFYLIARSAQYCPVSFVETCGLEHVPNQGARLLRVLQSALTGIRQVRHREAQKGILLFFQRYFNTLYHLLNSYHDVYENSRARKQLVGVLSQKNAQCVRAAIEYCVNLLQQQAGEALVAALVQGAAGGIGDSVPLVALDESNGSVGDALWSIRKLVPLEMFSNWIGQSLLPLSANVQDIAARMKLPEALSVGVCVVDNQAVSSTLTEKHFLGSLMLFVDKCARRRQLPIE